MRVGHPHRARQTHLRTNTTMASSSSQVPRDWPYEFLRNGVSSTVRGPDPCIVWGQTTTAIEALPDSLYKPVADTESSLLRKKLLILIPQIGQLQRVMVMQTTQGNSRTNQQVVLHQTREYFQGIPEILRRPTKIFSSR